MGFRTYILVFLFFWPSFTEASSACREALDEPISLYELAKARTQYMDALREAKRAGDLSSVAVFEAAELLSWRLFRRYEVETAEVSDEALAEKLRELIYFRLIHLYQSEVDFISQRITSFFDWLSAQHRRLLEPEAGEIVPTELEARQSSFAIASQEELYLVWKALQKLSERHQKALYVHWGISYFSFDADGKFYTLNTQETWTTEEKLEFIGLTTLAGVSAATNSALVAFERAMRSVLLEAQNFDVFDKAPPLVFLETWFLHRLFDSQFLGELQRFDFLDFEEETGLRYSKVILYHRFGLGTGSERPFRTEIRSSPIRDPQRIARRVSLSLDSEETRKILQLTLARLYELLQ